jgi:pimeloyl-ACP methyl ester carboxylesterase
MLRKLLKLAFIAVAVVIVVLFAMAAWFKLVLLPTPDYSELDGFHPFKSAAMQREAFELLERQAAQWPVASVTRVVRTDYGETFVRICGAADGAPLVLLPGGGQSSLMWIPNVAALAAEHRLYAVDNIVDFGRSRQQRSIGSGRELSDWLAAVLDELGLPDRVHVMGLSYGGWCTAQLALHHPEWVERAVLIAPAGTVYPLSGDFALKSIRALVFPSTLEPWLRSFCRDAASSPDPEVQRHLRAMVDASVMGVRSLKYKNMLAPTVLSDEELAAIEPPLLFLVGENEVLYPPAQAVARLNSVAPRIQTEIVAGAGHDITLVQAERVHELVLGFLGAGGIAAAAPAKSSPLGPSPAAPSPVRGGL